MDNPKPNPATAAERLGSPETGEARRRRHARRSRLYLYAVLAAVLLVAIAALIIANTRTVTVSWVFGSTHQPLVWVVLATAALSWLLGILTSMLFRFRTRAPHP
jgi:uncharacterized integral membrane protein